MIGGIIAFVLTNWLVILLLVASVFSTRKIWHARLTRRPFSASRIIWGELLFYVYGVGALYTGVLHAYFSAMVAATIGWAASPFQYELGWFEIATGITAMIGASRTYPFRLAATLPYTIFLLAAAAQHIRLMIVGHNYSPGNAGLVLWLGDMIVPAAMLYLAWLSRDAG